LMLDCTVKLNERLSKGCEKRESQNFSVLL
jgi:hypothetical protein